MSIKTFFANAFPMRLLGMADVQSTSVVSGLVDAIGFEVCRCDGCDFIETQFVKNGGSWWQNDEKSFIKSKIFATDTITFTLYKNGVQVATLNDSTYGQFFDFGDLAIAEYKGIYLSWLLVQQAFGYGEYFVRTTQVSLGETYTLDSHKFNVVEYNAERADGSVRIEVYQNGVIMSGFDYTGLNWHQSLRINGFFGDKIPEFISDNYQDVNRNVRQITAKIENTYKLITHLLPSYISDYLNEDAILSNRIQITDYNLLNQLLYRRFEVYLDDIANVTNHNFSKRSNYVYVFKKREDNIIKRNVNGDIGQLPERPSYTNFVCADGIILINGDSFSTVGSGETLDIPVKDTNGSEVGSKVGDEWIVPAGVTPSGVLLQFPIPEQYTSYRTGDEGWRWQNSFYNYLKPTNPAKIAELDMTLGANAMYRLKTALTVGGVSSTIRFVDVNGVQVWGATNNVSKITIDKLTGLGFYRLETDLGGAANWNTCIDYGVAFSVVVDGVTYSDWYLASRREFLSILGERTAINAVPYKFTDPISGIDIFQFQNSGEFWTATIQGNSSGANAYSKGFNPGTYLRGQGIGTSYRKFLIFDAKSLIS